MTIYIDQIVTEVVVQPEQSSTGESTDKRWLETQKIEAVVKGQHERHYRLQAEGLDD
jgi:hypothetical protein